MILASPRSGCLPGNNDVSASFLHTRPLTSYMVISHRSKFGTWSWSAQKRAPTASSPRPQAKNDSRESSASFPVKNFVDPGFKTTADFLIVVIRHVGGFYPLGALSAPRQMPLRTLSIYFSLSLMYRPTGMIFPSWLKSVPQIYQEFHRYTKGILQIWGYCRPCAGIACLI